jgi:formate-dependent nitrite reductase membrane component NrfD
MPDDSRVPPSRGFASGHDGTTYYGRPSLKHAPFNNVVVGSYIFLAGLSGAAQLLATLVRRSGRRGGRNVVRTGRWLSLAAPTIGAGLLIYDLHTPQRFYNMLRIFRSTSPMSIGTWILMAFSGSSALTWAGDMLGRIPGLHWLRPVGRLTELPAAASGAALGTYTAALLSATSTPLWAAAPRALAVRFGASSVASACAALSLAERRARNDELARDLDIVALAALGVELVASGMCRQRWKTVGLASAEDSVPGAMLLRIGADDVGTALPIVLHAAALVAPAAASRSGSMLASVATLVGSLCLRIGVMSAGDASSDRPRESLGFASPRNLSRQL